MRIENTTTIGQRAAAAKGEALEDTRLRKACKDFESLLVQQLLSKMRTSVPKSDLFGSKDKEEVFQSMLDEEYAKEVSESGSLGLGDLLYAQFAAQKKR
jgi:flagellar protein FlgJ